MRSTLMAVDVGISRVAGLWALRAAVTVALLLALPVTSSAAGRSAGRPDPAVATAPGVAACLQAVEQARDEVSRREAVTAFLVNLSLTVPAAQWSSPIQVGPYRVSFAKPGREPGLWDPTFFDGFVNPADVDLKDLRTRVVTPGAGTPLVGVRRYTPERAAADPFMPQTGYWCAVTAIVEFSGTRGGNPGREVSVRLHNPSSASQALAADFSAPLELVLANAPSYNFALRAFLKPAEHNQHAGLMMFQPYQPDKIPVVFVHGLDSSPRTWEDTFNELRADPEVRRNYQFWFFRYPTGNPVPLSAALLRETLESVRAKFDPKGKSRTFNQMIVVGHSMGGLLTRMLVT